MLSWYDDPMSGYIQIPLKSLLENHETPCDLYLALSSEKFVKIINANEIYDEDMVLKHTIRGVKNFNIKKEDEIAWQKFFTAQANLNLSKGSISQEETTKNLQDAFKRMRTLAVKAGLKDDLIETVEQIQDRSIKLFRKNKEVYSAICRIFTKENYLSDHSLLTSSIACATALNMSWSTQTTLKKFVIASLFHDISLEDPECARVYYLAELEVGDFDKKQKNAIKTHPEKSRDIFLKLGISCPNADKIILHHHELPDGTGFPNGLDAFNTPPYVCLFILSEEVASVLIRHNFKQEGWDYLKVKLTDFFMKGNYRKPIKGLQKTFKNST